jgi:hypothetical protein
MDTQEQKASSSSDVDVRTLRLLINLIRQSERDYLAKHIDSAVRADAWRSLFGLQSSPLAEPCRALGIDPIAARLRLILWRAKDMVGDPIFGYLLKHRSMDQWERGIAMDIPTLAGLHGDSRSRNSRTDRPVTSD